MSKYPTGFLAKVLWEFPGSENIKPGTIVVVLFNRIFRAPAFQYLEYKIFAGFKILPIFFQFSDENGVFIQLADNKHPKFLGSKHLEIIQETFY